MLQSYVRENNFCLKTSNSRQDQVPNGDFSYRNTAHWLTETPLPPPFPRPPVFAKASTGRPV